MRPVADAVYVHDGAAGRTPPRRPSLPVGTISRAGRDGKYPTIKTEQGWRYLHIHVYEQHLGRRLLPHEHVTWADGNPQNCDLANLVYKNDLEDRDPDLARAIEAHARASEQRRPRRPYPRTPRVQVQLGEDLHAWLANAAAADGRTLAVYCADLLTAHAIDGGMTP